MLKLRIVMSALSFRFRKIANENTLATGSKETNRFQILDDKAWSLTASFALSEITINQKSEKATQSL